MGVKRTDKKRLGELRTELGMKDSFKVMWKEWEMKNWRIDMPIKLREKGGEEDQECDGRTALREIMKEWRRMENNSKR